MYRVSISKTVSKQIESFPSGAGLKIVDRIRSLGENPRPHGCEKLSGEENLWRVRSGDYRIVYAVFDKTKEVKITVVKHRREVYR